MKQPSFLEGVAVALAASVAGSVLITALTPAFSPGAVLRLLIGGIGIAYVLYLLHRSPERVGRIIVVFAWTAAAVAGWFWNPPLMLYLALHIGLVWLVRSLYFHSSVLGALTDLGLSVFALATAIWAMSHTGSLFLALWCFFLVQALFIAIPNNLNRSTDERNQPDGEDRFQHAHRVAQAAIRQLSSLR